MKKCNSRSDATFWHLCGLYKVFFVIVFYGPCSVRSQVSAEVQSQFHRQEQNVVVAPDPVTDSTPVTSPKKWFDLFFPDVDVCENGPMEYGPCDHSRFPVCDPETELICYNRRPMRNRFYLDTRQPYYYIDYNSVFCYPNNWGGCSSCSPGRYCTSENRCILNDGDYPCAHWI